MSPQNSNKSTLFYKCRNDSLWTVIEINQACENIMGYPYQEIISNKVTFGNVILKKDIQRVRDSVEASLSTKQPFQIEYEMKTGTDEIKLVFEQGQGIYDEANNFLGLMGFISDITSNKSFLELQNDKELIKSWLKEIKRLSSKFNLTHLNLSDITEKEINIALYFSQGMSMKEIGKSLSLSPRTIEVYLNQTKSKLGCRLKTELRKLFFETETGKQLILNSIVK